MQDNIVLQKFKKFKMMFISSNIPNSILLEMAENFITADDDNAIEDVPTLNGQLTLFEILDIGAE